jgi:ribonuclease BN (tRNA processing enzyme)
LMPHFVDAYAVSVTSENGGGRFVFGSDSRPAQELVDFARGADLFLVEATLPRPERTGVRGHLTAEEAGQHGREAGVGKVVLTHISDELDQDQARQQAGSAFGGPVEVAREGAVYEI